MSYYIVVTSEQYGGYVGGRAALTEEENAITKKVYGELNTDVRVFEDLNQANSYRDFLGRAYRDNEDVVIIKQPSEYLQNQEKEICELKEIIRKQEETIAQQERTITKLYYSPGAPGACEAKEEFVKLASIAN